MKESTRRIQEALVRHGFNPGPVDGFMGPRTENAIRAFKRSIGLLDRSYVGPLTKAALFRANVGRPAPAQLDDLPWMKRAMSYLGLKEYRGSKHNPKILEWWVKIRMGFTDDETPWCAGFVGGVLEELGIRSTRSAAARSYHWKRWGRVLKEPCVGAIVVFWRKKRKGPYGHVGFVVGRDQHGNLMVLGGNQGNAVTIKPFGLNRVLSYHVPTSYTPPEIGFDALSVVNSDGRVSQNEA